MPKPILWLSLTLLTVLTGHILADVDLVTIPRREAECVIGVAGWRS
jgi:hypothetical protein